MTQSPTLQQHLSVTSHVTDLAHSITELVRHRLDPVTSPLIVNEEGNLLSCLASLQFLCSDLRTERIEQDNTSEQALDAQLDQVRVEIGGTRHV